MTHSLTVRDTRVFVEPSSDGPLVWIELAIRGGASADPVGFEGLHRHAALLARRGAGARDRTALDLALDDLGASLEPMVGRDSITLSATTLSRNLDRVVELLADIVAAPRFDLGEHQHLARETALVLDEVRDDDGALATRWFDHQCAPGHPYGRTSLGTSASLASLTVERAASCWRAEAGVGGLAIGVAGDIDEAGAAAIAERILARLPARAASIAPPAVEGTPPGRRLVLVDKAERTQAQLRLGHLGPRWGEPSSAALAVAETAFGGMFTSRLMQEIRVKRGWSYGAGCGLRRSRAPHWFEMWMATDIAVAGDAVALSLSLFESLAEHGISDEELTLARNYLTGSMPFQLATARQRMQIALRDCLVDLPDGFTIGLPAKLAELDVAAVKRACTAHLRPADVVTVAVATAHSVAERLAAAGAGPMTVVAHDAY